MKAVEFIKKHGCEYTVDSLKNYPSHTHTTDDGRMFFNENTCANEIKVQLIELVKFCDLKKYTDAYELVQKHGGLNGARKVAHKNCFNRDVNILKAISLVAEVENYNEKTKEGDPS